MFVPNGAGQTAVHGPAQSYKINEIICPVSTYLSPLLGLVLDIHGALLSTIHGNGTNVYVASVIPVSVSSEEILELITAPSSVVFLSKKIVHPVRVVNSSIVLRVFCMVLNQNVAACKTEFPDHAGLTPYAL